MATFSNAMFRRLAIFNSDYFKNRYRKPGKEYHYLRAQEMSIIELVMLGSCHKRQKTQAPTPQAPIRNRQTRKVANAKGLYRKTKLT